MHANESRTWISAIVLHGDQSGRQIGFPTINLNPKLLPDQITQGVYAAQVIIEQKNYWGALYIGPRSVKGEVHAVLEIYILDFSKEVYGQSIKFLLRDFIRPVIHFTTMEELKKQLSSDVENVRSLINKYAK